LKDSRADSARPVSFVGKKIDCLIDRLRDPAGHLLRNPNSSPGQEVQSLGD
jgi:hypothetical protein